MTTSRCKATKRAIHALARIDPSVREEIGWGEEFDAYLFNRFMDAYRTVDYLRKGVSLSGYGSMEEMYAIELSDAISDDDLRRLSDVEAALMLFRARAQTRC